MWRQKPEDLPIQGHVPAPGPLRPVVSRHVEPLPPAPPVALSQQGSIANGLTLRGDISGSDGLSIDGRVEGLIRLPGQRVIVGRRGQVVAPNGSSGTPCIRAREIIILGEVAGHIEAEDRVEMRASSSLVGNVTTHRVSIEDGAYFRGGIDIIRDQAPVPLAVPASPTAQPTPAAASEDAILSARG